MAQLRWPLTAVVVFFCNLKQLLGCGICGSGVVVPFCSLCSGGPSRSWSSAPGAAEAALVFAAVVVLVQCIPASHVAVGLLAAEQRIWRSCSMVRQACG